MRNERNNESWPGKTGKLTCHVWCRNLLVFREGKTKNSTPSLQRPVEECRWAVDLMFYKNLRKTGRAGVVGPKPLSRWFFQSEQVHRDAQTVQVDRRSGPHVGVASVAEQPGFWSEVVHNGRNLPRALQGKPKGHGAAKRTGLKEAVSAGLQRTRVGCSSCNDSGLFHLIGSV